MSGGTHLPKAFLYADDAAASFLDNKSPPLYCCASPPGRVGSASFDALMLTISTFYSQAPFRILDHRIPVGPVRAAGGVTAMSGHFTSISLRFSDQNKHPAELSFAPGLNVICGASETGKPFIVETIDFHAGSGKPGSRHSRKGRIRPYQTWLSNVLAG